MKRTILILAFATLLLPAVKLNAQVGFHAGYAPQKLVVKGPAVADRESASTLYHGFFGGIHYSFDIVGDLDFVPALQIRVNSANGNDDQFETQDWQFVMDLPLLLNYDFDLGHDVGLGLFAGPTLSYGINFTRKYKDIVTHAADHAVNRYGENLSYPELALRRLRLAAFSWNTEASCSSVVTGWASTTSTRCLNKPLRPAAFSSASASTDASFFIPKTKKLSTLNSQL